MSTATKVVIRLRVSALSGAAKVTSDVPRVDPRPYFAMGLPRL